jgi:uncharacterized Fe-S cluster protein YjdI
VPRRIKRGRARARKAYRSEKITVSFDLQRCIHARECVRGLPEVFDTEKRPWIQPDKAEPDAITTVVLRCPSGALRLEREDGVRETPPEENVMPSPRTARSMPEATSRKRAPRATKMIPATISRCR